MTFFGNWAKTCVASKEVYLGKSSACRICHKQIRNGDLSIAVRTKKIKRLVARFCTNQQCLNASAMQHVENSEWREEHPEAVEHFRKAQRELNLLTKKRGHKQSRPSL